MGPEELTIWLTGLPCSGKTTLARALELELRSSNLKVEVLDGDEVRRLPGWSLGFSRSDREENVKRIASLAKQLMSKGAITIVSAVSPYQEHRDAARSRIANFIEVYVNCSLEECVRRDVKGMYKKALSGCITNFTGISDPYEPPTQPELIIDTENNGVEHCTKAIVNLLIARGYLTVHGKEGIE